jgi:Tfp pilus assembly protein PilP
MTPRKELLAAAVGILLAAGAWAQVVPPEAYTVRRSAEEAVRKSRVHAAMTNAELPAGSDSAARSAAPVTATAAGVATQRPAKPYVGQGKRDPFVSIIQNLAPANGCSGGKKCLVIDEVVLKGVVKSSSGILALVENSRHRAFFLRENDPVFNGEVVHIGMSSITFREKVVDKAGREKSREVVRALAEGKPGA